MRPESPYKVCIIIPFYNNRLTVDSVAEQTYEYVQDIILINDGSTDGSEKVIKDRTGQIILHHDKNRGKGAAAMTGARHALKLGFTHFIQIDADEQMDPADIPAFLACMNENPESVIVGGRFFDHTVPRSSRFGRWFSNLWFSIETLGYPSPDTQCGYR